MKKTILLLAIFLLSSVGRAEFYGPLLSLTKSPGFAPPWWQIGTQCLIYPDKVEVKRFVGRALASSEVRKVQLENFVALDKVIAEAAKGKLTEETGPTDIPTIAHMATELSPLGVPKKVTLRVKGTFSVTNESNAATALINFIDLHCN